jgi:hypothetical protein
MTMNTIKVEQRTPIAVGRVRFLTKIKTDMEERIASVLSEGNTPTTLVDVLGKDNIETMEDCDKILSYLVSHNAVTKDKYKIASAITSWLQTRYEIEHETEKVKEV